MFKTSVCNLYKQIIDSYTSPIRAYSSNDSFGLMHSPWSRHQISEMRTWTSVGLAQSWTQHELGRFLKNFPQQHQSCCMRQICWSNLWNGTKLINIANNKQFTQFIIKQRWVKSMENIKKTLLLVSTLHYNISYGLN